MKYDTDRFYKISAFFEDNFCFMALVIELRLGIDRRRANKELLHGRYKPEYLDALEGVRSELKADPAKPYKEAVFATIPKTDVIFVNAQVALLSARETLPPEQTNAIANAARDEFYNRRLIENATQKNLAKITEMLDKNTKYEKVGVGDGVQTFEPVELNANDYKALQDAIDKASLTLGVNPRFSNTTINNANVSQEAQIQQIVISKDE